MTQKITAMPSPQEHDATFDSMFFSSDEESNGALLTTAALDDQEKTTDPDPLSTFLNTMSDMKLQGKVEQFAS